MEDLDVKMNTYLSTAQTLIDKNPEFYDGKQKEGILSFAKYLDSFKTVGVELQLLALQKARLIDREFILALCDEIGKEKAIFIARKINQKHIHSK